MNFDSADNMFFQNVFLFLLKNPAFAIHGFHNGFGKTLFNMLLVQNKSERWLAYNFAKLHILGVKDTQFLQLANKLLDENAHSFAANSFIYINLYHWWRLDNRKVHR